MIENINLFLNQRSKREQIYLYILSVIFGIFVSLHLSSALFSSVFEDFDLSKDLLILQDQNIHNQELEQKILIIEKKLEEQNHTLNKLKIGIAFFEKDYKSYLDELYALAKQEGIIFERFNHISNKHTSTTSHTLKLEFKTSFHQGLKFLHSLYLSNFIFELESLSMQKLENSLKFKVRLRFFSL